MATIRLHGNPFSTATMRAAASLHEKQLEFEFVLIDMKNGEHKKEPFISLNVSITTLTNYEVKFSFFLPTIFSILANFQFYYI